MDWPEAIASLCVSLMSSRPVTYIYPVKRIFSESTNVNELLTLGQVLF